MEQKIKDSVKARSCSVRKGFVEDIEGINEGECHEQNYKQGVRCNAYVCSYLLILFMPCTAYKGLTVGLEALFFFGFGGCPRLVNKSYVM